MVRFSPINELKPNRTVKSWFKGLSVPGQVFSLSTSEGVCLCLSYSCQNCGFTIFDGYELQMYFYNKVLLYKNGSETHDLLLKH